jgi:hypothetical protein
MKCTVQVKMSRSADRGNGAVSRRAYRRTTSQDVPRGNTLRSTQRSALTMSHHDPRAEKVGLPLCTRRHSVIDQGAGRCRCEIDPLDYWIAIEMTLQTRTRPRTAFHVEHMFDCTLFHIKRTSKKVICWNCCRICTRFFVLHTVVRCIRS